jgi:alkylation response protein AidB-like acyl-CoA dehydrogenase
MDMKLSDEQIQLRESARALLESECTLAFVREMERSEPGFSREMWREMAGLGWLGICLPERDGGLGLGILDQVILAKQLGRNLCPSPYLSTAVIGAEALVRAGSAGQRQAFLPGIVGGDTLVAFAFQEHGRDFDAGVIRLRAREEGGDWVLDGTKMFVEWADAADLLLVAARTSDRPPSRGGLTLFLVDARSDGIECKRTPTLARDHHCELIFRKVRVPRERVLGPVDGAWSVLEGVIDRAAVVFSAFCVGLAERMHELATRFAGERVQFDRPIGQMQVIQNYLATLVTEIYGADTLVLFTAFSMDRGRRVRDHVAKTKAFCAETVKRTTDICSQIFGGTGYMEETDTTLYLRRGKQYQLMLGGVDYWEKIVAEELLGAPRPAAAG